MTTQEHWATHPASNPTHPLVRPKTMARDAQSEPAIGDAGLIRRLVVVVPSFEVNLSELAGQIQALARPRHLAVLLMAQRQNPHDEWHVRRGLATLSALVADAPHITVETRVVAKPDWVDAVRDLRQAGDLVVCQREHTVFGRWPWNRRALVDAIRDGLHVAVCALEGLYPDLQPPRHPAVTFVRAWVVPILLIVAFGWIEYEIQGHTTGWVGTLLLSVTAVLEIGLLGLTAARP